MTTIGGHDRVRDRTTTTSAAAVVVTLLCLTTLLVFLPLRHAEFLNYDDGRLVAANPHTQAGLTWDGLVWAATDRTFHWIPLTWLSFMLGCQLFGADAGAHHLISVALHVANSGLLLYVLLRLTGALWPSAFVAALFALHPLHVEAAAWLSSRTHLLSTWFWLAALLSYVRYTERRTRGRYLLVCLCLLLGLLSKNMIVTLPFTLLLLDYWPLPRRPTADGRIAPVWSRAWRLWREKLPLLVIAGLGVAMELVLRTAAGPGSAPIAAPLLARLADALVSYGAYAWRMLWPAGLATPYPPYRGFPPLAHVAGAVLWLAVTSALVIRFGRTRRYLVVGWLWYLVTLLPVIGLVPLRNHAMADRYTYVPLIGLFVMIAWGAADLARARSGLRPALATGAILTVLASIGLSRAQVAYWHDSISLFQHTVAVTRDNLIAHINLGVALKSVGQGEAAQTQFAAALAIDPDHAEAHGNMASVLLEAGQFAAAEAHAREALRVRPDSWEARLDLGAARLAQRDAGAARHELSLAVALQPRDANARFWLAQALEAEGRLSEALAEYERALQLDPALPRAHFRFAVALETAGRTADAIGHYQAELRRDPAQSDVENALGTALRAAGRHEEARTHFAAALRINPANASAHNNFGVSLGDQGASGDAAAHFREAVRLDPRNVAARLNLGFTQLQADDPAGAREQFAAAIELDPANPTLYSGLAQACERERRIDEAQAAYERAIALDADFPDAQRGLARLREAAGDPAAARRHYGEVLRMIPDDPEARAALTRLGANDH